MPIEPGGNEPEGAGPAGSAPPRGSGPPRAPLERSRFGGTERRGRDEDDSTPVSRSDLSRGPQELLEHRSARINWQVLVASSLVILAFSLWAIAQPDEARVTMKATVDWIALNLGWYYVLTVTLVIGFVLWVALSKEGNVRRRPCRARSIRRCHAMPGTWRIWKARGGRHAGRRTRSTFSRAGRGGTGSGQCARPSRATHVFQLQLKPFRGLHAKSLYSESPTRRRFGMPMNRQPVAKTRTLALALAAAVGLSACATYDDEFAGINSRLDRLDSQVQNAAQSAESANQSAQRANQRLDQMESRVQQIESAPRRVPRG